jgi:hypothetical protein
MKIFILIILMIINGFAASAQQVVASAGHSGSAAGVVVDWTLGEAVIETFTGSGSILTQGMHQTKLSMTGIGDFTVPGLDVKVFPNPVTEVLTIEAIQVGNPLFWYELMDMTGRKSVRTEMRAQTEKLDLTGHAPGIYLLRIFSPGSGLTGTFKIIKQ